MQVCPTWKERGRKDEQVKKTLGGMQLQESFGQSDVKLQHKGCPLRNSALDRKIQAHLQCSSIGWELSGKSLAPAVMMWWILKVLQLEAVSSLCSFQQLLEGIWEAHLHGCHTMWLCFHKWNTRGSDLCHLWAWPIETSYMNPPCFSSLHNSTSHILKT